MTIREVLFGSDSLTPKQENMRQLVMYPFAGIFTALANFLSFVIIDFLMKEPVIIDPFGFEYDLTLIVKQFVSWVVTIITAHSTNRIFVFRSHGNYFLELLGFAAARLFTFATIEVVLFSLMVGWANSIFGLEQHSVLFSIFGFDVTCIYIVKIVSNIILIIVNFILSKWIVFKATDPSRRKGKKREDVTDASA